MTKKNVLGIIGSTRKRGNSELAVKMISRQIPEPHTLNLLRLSDLDIKPCLGCYKCISKHGKCIQDDDMEIFLGALARADGVIISVPVYFFGPNGLIKMVVDRCCMIYPRFEMFFGKPCLIVIPLGVKGKDGYTSAALGSATMTMGLHIVGEAQFLAAGLGEVLTDQENHELARTMGRALFSSQREIGKEERRCQICASRSFKFINEGVECLVCQNRGDLVSRDGKIDISIENSSTSEVMTLEDRLHHLEWVKGKKGKYAEKRKEIRNLGREFADDGVWIRGKGRDTE